MDGSGIGMGGKILCMKLKFPPTTVQFITLVWWNWVRWFDGGDEWRYTAHNMCTLSSAVKYRRGISVLPASDCHHSRED